MNSFYRSRQLLINFTHPSNLIWKPCKQWVFKFRGFSTRLSTREDDQDSFHRHYGKDGFRDRFRSRHTGSSREDYKRDLPYISRNRSSAVGESNKFENRYRLGQRQTKDFALKPVDWTRVQLEDFVKNFYSEAPSVAALTPDDVQVIFKEHQISVSGVSPIPRPIQKFSEAGFPDDILLKLQEQKIYEPTAIQRIGLPIVLSGRDFIGISRTGSGKTIAFVTPALVHLKGQSAEINSKHAEGPIVLILTPTRELTSQIHSEIRKLATSAVRSVAVYGGADKYPQAEALKNGVEIVIACPGRLLDFISTGLTKLHRTTYLVLDEADRMLDMGFEPQIRQIVSQIRPDRQTIMYSATWPKDVEHLARDLCKEEPVQVKIGNSNLHANPDIQQEIKCIPRYKQHAVFLEEIEKLFKEGSQKALVFCSTKLLCDRIAREIRIPGVRAASIHGGMSQLARDRAIDQLRSNQIQILVGTDVAARGLDITDISAVYNYDLPRTAEDYVHRIGRTGRCGKKGKAFTMIAADDNHNLISGLAEIVRRAGQKPSNEFLQMLQP